jgi:muconolactone delta-isomerase
MQFLSVSRRRTESFSDGDFAAKREQESERVRQLYVEGTLRQIWLRGDGPGTCILWEAASEKDVRAKLESLPFAIAGMLEIQMVMPIGPYPGFGPRA